MPRSVFRWKNTVSRRERGLAVIVKVISGLAAPVTGVASRAGGDNSSVRGARRGVATLGGTTNSVSRFSGLRDSDGGADRRLRRTEVGTRVVAQRLSTVATPAGGRATTIRGR